MRIIRYARKTVGIAAMACALAACGEEALRDNREEFDLNYEPVEETDKWIQEHITRPYNIEILYKWVDGENDMGKNLVPPKTGDVIPFAKILKRVFIDAYVKEAGKDFFNRLAPKQFLFVGSHSYNQGNTITEGTAEGGRKIVLYGINYFREAAMIRRFVHVMHHEFSHIMHQTRMFSPDYQKISAGGYTAQWYNTPGGDNGAREMGFITSYARAAVEEDFVEMLSVYITTPREEWEEWMRSIAEPRGREAIERKLEAVRTYMLQNWEIDLEHFRKEMEKTLKKVYDELQD